MLASYVEAGGELNKLFLKGKLVRAPDFSLAGTKQIPLAKFSLTVPDKLKPKDRDKTYFANCEAWGKVAELIHQWVRKGQEILVEAHLTKTVYKQGRKNVYQDHIVVDTFEFCGYPPKKDEAEEFEMPEFDDIPF